MEEEKSHRMYNLFVKHLNGKTLTLLFPSPILYATSIKDRLFHLTGIPIQHQRLVTGCRHLNDDKSAIWCSPEGGNMFPSVRLLLRLKGGKGGFGSLLRGAATKAGQKKTNNFDACRDMSGRRLRHVNAEKRLEEWREGEEDRKLEKVAEDFLKKQMKKNKGKGKNGVEGEAQKYVAKYREQSERCVADVALSVQESLRNSKRKSSAISEAPRPRDQKKLKIWMGKRPLDESDNSDDSDEDVKDVEEETEKSVLLNSQNESGLNKADDSSDSVTGLKRDGGSSGVGSCESGSEEERETVVEEGRVETVEGSPQSNETIEAKLSVDAEPMINDDMAEANAVPCSEMLDSGISAQDIVCQDNKVDDTVTQASDLVSSEIVPNDMEIDVSLEHKPAVIEESLPNTVVPAKEEPLNFDAFNTAAELEALGLEKLKTELQSRGLKCGGTLQERAARLFLLKSTPLDKLPKKLLAKK
ncbi:uncharacterized protein LOC127132125 [Lathyrus oleraceus]|uniref:Uncharacterized protein n=1 Tax=Pisum sativum TaxID=3888 RepID=A0A9D5AVV0_PEA|nr:uncharacterized protein LOC127132125 [Pisum sativum]KAI5423818.1 hypothetical protein KIW84_030149 [Pisum sativum]